MNFEILQNILENKEIPQYKYLGTLSFIGQKDKIVQWYWQQKEGLKRVVFLSLNIDDTEVDGMIGDNRGYFDTFKQLNFSDSLETCTEEKVKQWIDNNLYNIHYNDCPIIFIGINTINAHFEIVWKALGLGEYQRPGFLCGQVGPAVKLVSKNKS